MSGEVVTDPAADAAQRLLVTQSNFAAAIRQAQTAGLTPKAIGEVVGLRAIDVRMLITSWGLA